LISDLQAAGIPARSGDSAILEGVRSVKWFLRIRGEDEERYALLTIDPRCVNTIAEMTAYVWKKEQDLPVDKNNHALDALRYVCKHFGGSFTEPRVYAADKKQRTIKHDDSVLTFEDIYQRGVDEEPELISVEPDGDFGWNQWS